MLWNGCCPSSNQKFQVSLSWGFIKSDCTIHQTTGCSRFNGSAGKRNRMNFIIDAPAAAWRRPNSQSWLVFHLAHIQLICTGSGMQSSGSLSTEFEIFLTFEMCQSGLHYETKEKKWAEPNSLPICTNLTEKLFPNFWKLDAMDETVVSATTVFRVLNYDLG